MSLEIIGYLAMFVTVLSFLFKDQMELRLANAVACLLWVAYGVCIDSYPIIIVNLIIYVIHIVWVYKNRKTKK